MVYLVHHTLNRNGTYTGGKRNPLPIHGLSPKDNSRNKQKPETNKSKLFSIQNQWKMCDFECPIYGIINSGKIEGAYLGRVRSMF